MTIFTRLPSSRLLPSLVAVAALLSLLGCPPADPGAGSAAPAAPAATAPPAAAPAAASAAPAAAADEAPAADAGEATGETTEAAPATDEAPATAGDPGETAGAAAEVSAKLGEDSPRGENDDLIDGAFGAFKSGDFEKIAGYRAQLSPALVDEMMAHYKTSLPWDIKDGFTHLMVHRYEAVVIPLMTDSLESKRVESRAQAIATLRQAKDMIGTMHDDKGGIDPSKVADAIKEYRAENP